MQLIDDHSVIRTQIQKMSVNKLINAEDNIAVEEPLEIQLRYGGTDSTISVTMRTPGHDEELAAGFLFTERIISASVQIENIEKSQNGSRVVLKNGEEPALKNVSRNFYTTSSCGVCGKSSIESIKTESIFSTIADNIIIPASIFYSLPDKARKEQDVFESTGGLHASALFDLEGNFLMLREDVGRHNALDKIIGAAFLNDQLPLTDNILLLSGRASFELIQKATMAGIKIIAAIGAPSSLAVELARDNNLTLLGFLRNDRFNIYSGDHRIEKK